MRTRKVLSLTFLVAVMFFDVISAVSSEPTILHGRMHYNDNMAAPGTVVKQRSWWDHLANSLKFLGALQLNLRRSENGTVRSQPKPLMRITGEQHSFPESSRRVEKYFGYVHAQVERGSFFKLKNVF